jgi:hypothetical protein
MMHGKKTIKFYNVRFEIPKRYKLYSGRIDSIPLSAVFQKSKKLHLYTHPLLYDGSYFAVSQIRGIAARRQIYHSYPLVARSIEIVRQLELVIQPYYMIFNEWKGKSGKYLSQNFCTEKRNTRKMLNHGFTGERSWNQTLAKSEG